MTMTMDKNIMMKIISVMCSHGNTFSLKFHFHWYQGTKFIKTYTVLYNNKDETMSV